MSYGKKWKMTRKQMGRNPHSRRWRYHVCEGRKGILEFDEDTLIKEINNENNLVCPNHHIMLEKGLISLE